MHSAFCSVEAVAALGTFVDFMLSKLRDLSPGLRP